MQEFILTLVVIFVLFKIFGRSNVFNFNQHNHTNKTYTNKVSPPPNQPKSKIPIDEGEYIDFEEIK